MLPRSPTIACLILSLLGWSVSVSTRVSAQDSSAAETPAQQSNEFVDEVAQLVAARDTTKLRKLLEAKRKTQPADSLILMRLVELYASEGKDKSKRKTKDAIQRLLALPASASFAHVGGADAAKSRARAIGSWLDAKRKLWVLSSFDRIRLDKRALTRKRESAAAERKKSERRIPKLEADLARWRKSKRRDRGLSIAQLQRDLKKHRRRIASKTGEIATFDDALRRLEKLASSEAAAQPSLDSKSTHKPEKIRNLHDSPVKLGVAWLVAQQQKDASWPAPVSRHAVGVTALATLVLMGYGSDTGRGPHRKNVQRAVDWLLAKQQPSGFFGPAGPDVYSHALATLALLEAHRFGGDDKLRAAAQRGVTYIIRARNPSAGWRYTPMSEKSDSSVTAWNLLVLVAAKRLAIKVDPAEFDGATAWLRSVTDPKTGATGYLKVGEGSSRSTDMVNKFPTKNTEALTAASLCARLLVGERAADHPTLDLAVKRILDKPARWSPTTIDFYYWFWASQAMSHVDKQNAKAWKRVVVPSLQQGQYASGKWRAEGPWCREGGEVYATAMACLSLMTAKSSNRLFFVGR